MTLGNIVYREYWMITEDQVFSRSYDSAPRAPPSPFSSVSKLSRSSLLTGERREWGWARSQIIRPREGLALYKSFNGYSLIVNLLRRRRQSVDGADDNIYRECMLMHLFRPIAVFWNGHLWLQLRALGWGEEVYRHGNDDEIEDLERRFYVHLKLCKHPFVSFLLVIL